MRILRVYPAANDPRHRKRELALVRRGHDVGLVLPRRYGSDWVVGDVEPEITHWRASLLNSTSIPFHLWPPPAIIRAVREWRPDVVDIHEEPYWPSGAEIAFLAHRRPLALYSAQNLRKPLPAPVALMQRAVLGRAGACYPCSSGAADVLWARGFTGYVEVVPIGVDDELFEVRPMGDRVGFIGRLVEAKGVRDLLRYGPRLLAVGDGPLAQAVRDAGGEVRPARSVAELAAALAEMSILVAPSRTTREWREQFGRMVVEAMAAGVPVVASDSGSLPEVVGDAGLIVREGDNRALHEAVESVLRDPGAFSARGRERARRLYSWDVVAAAMERVYMAAIERRRAAL